MFFMRSFLTDYQLVADCSIQLEIETGPAGARVTSNESLWPNRHKITLPVNGLNIMFSDYTVCSERPSRAEFSTTLVRSLHPPAYWLGGGGGWYPLLSPQLKSSADSRIHAVVQ
jgi:hypothetical protein